MNKHCSARGWKPAVKPQRQTECIAAEDSACLPTANNRLWPISDHLIFFCANKSSQPLRWHELFAVATPPSQTHSCMWSAPKANTVKNLRLNRVHELHIVLGQNRGILSPFCLAHLLFWHLLCIEKCSWVMQIKQKKHRWRPRVYSF